MARYLNQPGAPAATAPQDFPGAAAAGFDLDSSKPTMVVLAHPRCPCTNATLTELAVLMTKYPDRLKAYVFFYQPSTEPDDWSRTDLWRKAGQIPGVNVLPDRDARQSELFEAFTSGQILLYSPQGKLLFKGGITAGRGHEGANAGSREIENYLNTGEIFSNDSFVYGCAITADD